MSSEIISRVVTPLFHEDTLAEINELSNQLTRPGFTLALNDDEGNIHEPGINTFGLLSMQNAEEVKAPGAGLAETAR